ncbi:MAG: lysophospholipase [Pseudomonadales bacterium]|nr:lysophospholipase [Pseudomonadales bacterium]
MAWRSDEVSIEKITERAFDLTVNGQNVPGVYWRPKSGNANRIALLGHGGSTHKKVEYVQLVATLLAQRGIASMAIDGPGHGERASGSEVRSTEGFSDIWNAGGGTQGIVADWHAALNFIEAEEGVRPACWWGLSMGTMMGLPVTASDTRIRVALLGLMGIWGPNGDDLKRLAPEVLCPVRFLVQWDDEIVPREACLELYDALGSEKKTLHANPGIHTAVPQTEIAGSVEYLDRYLK